MAVEVGFQCPMCYRLYVALLDGDKPLDSGSKESTTAHCPHCKRHPALVAVHRYELSGMREVSQFPEPVVEVSGGE